MTVLSISQDTLIMLPDGATGGAVQISYNGTTSGPVIASGNDRGRAVLVEGRLARLTALDRKSPLRVVGREAGGRMPARVTLLVYPEGSAVVAPIILSGLPVASPDAPGIWDLSNIYDASGGLDVVLPGERQAIALLRERAATAADQAEAAAHSASSAEAKAAATIGRLDSSINSAATQAAAGTVARVDRALADTAQQQQANNAQAAINLGRKAAPSVADMGAEPGLYNITSSSEAGQVWERLQDGAKVRRAGLEAASTTSIAQRTFTPEQFGAVGDGVTSDHEAFLRLSAAVRAAGGGRILLSQPYLLGRHTSSDPQQAAFLDFQRIPGLNLVIEFSGRGEMILDNLNSGGHGDQYGGIVVRGSAEYIEIIRPRVGWKHQPSARTSGYGVCIKGYPDEAHPDYIARCIIRDPEVASAPQGGVIVMGVDNLLVTNARFARTMADGLHINACRNPVVVGPVRAIEIGDDALALVTYAGTETRPLGPDEGYADPNHLYTPFQTVQDSPWANGNVQADGAWRIGGHGHAARCNGVNGGYIGSLIGENAQRVLILDGTKRDGTPAKLWNAGVNRGLKIGAVIARGCGQALAAIADGERGKDDAMFFNQDVEIGSIQASGTTAEDAVVIDGANGIRIGTVHVDKDVRVTGGSIGTRIDRVKARNVIFDAQSNSVVSFIEAQRIDLFNQARVSGTLWRSQYAPGQAIRAIGLGGSLRLARLEIDHPNRTGGPGTQMMLLAPFTDLTIGQIYVTHDGRPTVLFEIGGGSADGRSSSIDLGQISYYATAGSAPQAVLQSGAFGPRNIRYSVRATVDGGGTFVNSGRNDFTDPAPCLTAARVDTAISPDTSRQWTPVATDNTYQRAWIGWDSGTGMLTAEQRGTYLINVSLMLQNTAPGDQVNLAVVRADGSEVGKVFYGQLTQSGGQMVSGSFALTLAVGEQVYLGYNGARAIRTAQISAVRMGG
ncbi:hypothetical protein [Deinococcus wulumuqiensis]|uniref:hypothetical protein n=1 Tax=Deinococcus wulumuqiensis TaxID=980427 RepID=UPI00242E89BF|nr:hypothetical protein [Deinococcus wulumuqiensis]